MSEEKEKEEINTKYEWDGEKIKRTTTVPIGHVEPMSLLQQLDEKRHSIDQMEENLIKMQEGLVKQKEAIVSAKEVKKEMEEFEEKSIEIQKEKLDLFVRQIKEVAEKEAAEEAEEIFQKDPSAYTEEQKVNQRYVIYQQKLGRNEKIAKRIASRIIKEFLYDKPIFENPFKPKAEPAKEEKDVNPEASPQE